MSCELMEQAEKGFIVDGEAERLCKGDCGVCQYETGKPVFKEIVIECGYCGKDGCVPNPYFEYCRDKDGEWDCKRCEYREDCKCGEFVECPDCGGSHLIKVYGRIYDGR